MSRQQFFQTSQSRINQKPIVTEEELVKRANDERKSRRNLIIYAIIALGSIGGFIWFFSKLP